MGRFFEDYQQKHDFTTLRADGFSQRVPGVVFTDEKRPCCGVPLGGIGTGCIDFDLRGVFGWSTLFFPVSQMGELGCGTDPRTARRMPDVQPVFAFSAGENNYIAATEEIRAGGRIPWCTAPGGSWTEEDRPQAWIELPEIKGVKAATGVEYYGHYPMADAEYTFEGPVSLGVAGGRGERAVVPDVAVHAPLLLDQRGQPLRGRAAL